MSDSFTEVSSQGWFSRIGGAIKAVVIGCLLFALSFPLLFWNEGRAVKTYKSLKEGAQSVMSVDADKLNAANSGKLVHMHGQATTDETLADSTFGISSKALKLKRVVQYYQWKESKKSNTEKKLGGSSETTTTYNYDKVWSDKPIDSSEFKKPAEHENVVPVRFDTTEFVAGKVMLGAYRLSRSLVAKIDDYDALPVSAAVEIPAALKDKVKINGSEYYAGANPQAPAIGDVRISFKTVTPTEVSIVSKQVSDTFEPYTAKAGGTVELLTTGVHSADEMFKSAQSQNTITTWIFRLIGFVIMFIGVSMGLKPLSVLADVVPFFGSIVEFGAGIVAFLVAAPLSLVTIAIAWIFYRPLLGITLLAVAGALAYLATTKFKMPVKTAAPVPVTS